VTGANADVTGGNAAVTGGNADVTGGNADVTGGNADVRAARAFHERTAHTPSSVRASGHALDWDVKPLPFKIYADLPAVPLPRDLDPLDADTLGALAAVDAGSASRLTLEALATLLYFSAGVTKRKRYAGGAEVLFRAAPSTGALYQTEVYVAAGDVVGLPPGLYHFNPGDFALRCLRGEDVRAALAEAAADEAIARRAATVVLSGIYWRNTWKYQARGYRHLFWDSGTMLANLTAVAGVLGLGPRIVTGFADAAVNRVLGVDLAREAALELVPVGPEGDRAPAVGIGDIAHDVVPLSTAEVDYPVLREMHRASTLDTPDAVRAWRAARMASTDEPSAAGMVALPSPRRRSGRGLGETVQRRGSTRRFSHASISAGDLSTVLACAARAVPRDVMQRLVDIYLVLNAVDGIDPGAYVYRPDAHGLEPLRRGQLRRDSAFLCLEQALGGDAAAVMFFLSPLDAVLAAYGNRGYRLVNLEAGLAGGLAYLAAYGSGFGASGLTFYDGAVVDFFSPHAAGKDAIFVTAIGASARG
jgi:SagB-type dehydrogenase family enzyme